MDNKERKLREITSKDQLTALLNERSDNTETWLVRESVVESLLELGTNNMREMTETEITDLAEYLDTNVQHLNRPFMVDNDLHCPKCARKLTFLDFVKTAIEGESGFHTKEMIAEILSGRKGNWLTIGGKNFERTVYCSNCGEGIIYRTHNYSNRNYAYA